MTKPADRFGRRVESYVRSRPAYPQEVAELLKVECGLTPGWAVADIGSGTGILSRLFLDNGCRVYGVEPNVEMRRAGEALLATYRLFASLDGTAEDTGLPDDSADLIAADTRIGSKEIQAFYGSETYATAAFDNHQSFRFDGLKARLLSSSYTPGPNHPRHTDMLRTLREIFEAHEVDDHVNIEYDTHVYYGQLEG